MTFNVTLNRSNAKQPVLSVKIKPPAEGQPVSAGEQAVLQDYLNAGNYRAGGKLKNVKDSVIGEPVKDEKGRPLEAQLLASAGVIDAMATRMIINNTRAQELKKQLTEMKAVDTGDKGKGRT